MIENRYLFRKRTLTSCLFLIACTIVPAYAQKSVAIVGAVGGSANRTAANALHARNPNRKTSTKPGVVVFTGDTVFAQVVEGDTWKTSFIINNLDSGTRHCELRFFGDDGNDMFLPIFSDDLQGDLISGVSLTIGAGGTVFFETAGDSPTLSQGWALLVKDNSADAIGGMAVFRQRRPGYSDSEAVVPVVNQFDGHFVLIFDNTNGFVTGMAIANPTSSDVIAIADVR
jgi:hypothetical protein